MRHLLLIDDDDKLGALLKDYLRQFDMSLDSELSPGRGLSALKNGSYELVILDIMLPEMDGFAVCRQIREHRSIYGSIPIIMLTARGDVTDRIVGLELGADDYLGKPFEPRELVARIENILRRSQDKPQNKNAEAQSYTSAGLSVDYARRTVLLDNEPLVLTTMEFELLRVFIKSDGAVLSRDELMNQLRGIDAELYSRAVDTLVSRLRYKLKDTSKPARFIKTIWGKGYTFIQSPSEDACLTDRSGDSA